MLPGLFTPHVFVIPGVEGSPEGHFDSQKGQLVVDKLEPAIYQKSSDAGTLTGWVKIAGSIAPVGTTWRYWEDANMSDAAPSSPTFAVERRFRNGDPPVVWDPQNSVWA